jgi:predicted nuclease of restriction endonuclease-like (RecB) superfamily
MSGRPTALMQTPEGYADWLAVLKTAIHNAQQRATLAVNKELVLLYWRIGSDILARQTAQGWGAKVIERLAHDLQTAFPGMKGFSPRNLKYMRAFAEAWPDLEFVQAVLAQLPWYHQIALLDKLDATEERSWYAKKAIEHNWSRNVLVMQIETRLHARQGHAVTNFEQRLPKPDSDLARESIKDPYRFDFLGLTNEAQERAIEGALVQHVTQFLLELGAGFAFVGRQVLLQVGEEEFFIDLLFYHLKLRCYVVIELKADKFKPEHLGQLGFYMTAVDKQIKAEHDSATIGLLLCKSKDKIVAEYALGDKTQPMGIAEYKLIESLPDPLKTNLPSIEQIERELQGGRL